MRYSTALQWYMVPSHAAQHSTTLLGTAPYKIFMAQVLVADAGENLIGYTGMVIVACCPRLNDPFAYCGFPHVLYACVNKI